MFFGSSELIIPRVCSVIFLKLAFSFRKFSSWDFYKFCVDPSKDIEHLIRIGGAMFYAGDTRCSLYGPCTENDNFWGTLDL